MPSPDADGRDVCTALRAAGQDAPVLFLTARGWLTDLVSGSHAGGDDYLTKPFAVAELQVRVAAMAARHRPVAPSAGLHLDPRTFAVNLGDASVRLTPTELRLLAALAARPGEVVRRHELAATGWPMGTHVSDSTLDSFVRRVRTTLAVVAPRRRRRDGPRRRVRAAMRWQPPGQAALSRSAPTS